ncbi:MAG: replication-associated recombination protein A [Planctomycetota bacterium]|jgi:putative ATPase
MSRSQEHEAPLIAAAGRRAAAERASLAERMRPTGLSDIVGQDAVVRALRDGLVAGRIGSLLLWGPPGTGKTSLARLLAREAGVELRALSAVGSGVADLRSAIREAEQRLGAGGVPTLLFIDEIHRFHKGQQDALLHAVEDGRLQLVGATTENPSFHVNGALLSRCRVLRLQALDERACGALVRRALDDAERGLGGLGVSLDADAADALQATAGGDARRLLDTLERAALAARASDRPRVTAADVRTALGERLPGHDRGGDSHYDLLSALHKSLRGGDPDAASYYVQRLLGAGEDAHVVARRLVRMASEDIGLADPRALRVALDAVDAVAVLGLPEGDAALVQAAVYLALAPKSDAVARACAAARAAVEADPEAPVPLGLRNAPTALLRATGAGRGYVNPHRSEPGAERTSCLPESLKGSRFYDPVGAGAEAAQVERLQARSPGSADKSLAPREASSRRSPPSAPPGPGSAPPGSDD